MCVYILLHYILDEQHVCISSDVKSQVRPEFDSKPVSVFRMEN